MSVTVSIVDDIVSMISCCDRMVKSSSIPSFILWLARKRAVSSSMAFSLTSSESALTLMLEK